MIASGFGLPELSMQDTVVQRHNVQTIRQPIGNLMYTHSDKQIARQVNRCADTSMYAQI